MKHIDFFLILLVALVIVLPLNGCQVNEGQPLQEVHTPSGQSTLPTVNQVNVLLGNVHLQVSASGLAATFPPACTGQDPECFHAKEGMTFLAIELNPSDLPQGDMLDYKNLPAEIAVRDDTAAAAGVSYRIYKVTTRTLTLAFEVSRSAKNFSLLWPGSNPIPLQPVQQAD